MSQRNPSSKGHLYEQEIAKMDAFYEEMERRKKCTPDIDELWKSEQHILFVYDNLKSGFQNHAAFLTASDYLGRCSTVENNYVLRTAARFPLLFRKKYSDHDDMQDHGYKSVYGEAYAVTPKKLMTLDQHFDNQTNFLRMKTYLRLWDQDTPFKDKRNNVCREAWLYIANPVAFDEGQFRVANLLGKDGTYYWNWLMPQELGKGKDKTLH